MARKEREKKMNEVNRESSIHYYQVTTTLTADCGRGKLHDSRLTFHVLREHLSHFIKKTFLIFVRCRFEI
jgi:hypothetical protein